jgi:multicomponent Na+:H+ antiporter subunit D
MAITGFLCIFIGSYTPYLYRMLPYQNAATEYAAVVYSSYHVSETLQILLFTALGFFLLIKKLEPEAKISLDLDWPYRIGGRALLWIASKPIQFVDTYVGEVYRVAGLVPLMSVSRIASLFDAKVIDGLVDGFAGGFKRIGERLRSAQRGVLQENLTVAFGVSAVVVVAVLLWVR